MTTWTALTTLPDRAAAAALGDALDRLDPAPTGVGLFEIEDGSGLWEVGGYFTLRPDAAGLALLAALHGARDFAISRVEDRDWVAQVRRELTPVRAGRFVVHGRHDRARVPPQLQSLEIEAAMAFGTGHHGTTLGCLRAIDHLAHQGLSPRRIADIGCGTGVLVMAAGRAWRRAVVIAADIDPVAVATARANIRANRLPPLAVIRAAGFRHADLRALAPYDLVCANILARPLASMAPQMAAYTVPDARLILSGILEPQAARLLAIYGGWGFRLERRFAQAPWVTLVLRRFADVRVSC
ncbi:MAG: 50S ribosomal protein L11 methyltransferase [Pseudomonadota bacterium]